MLSRSLSALHVKKAFQDWSETLPLNRASVKREISEKSHGRPVAAQGSVSWATCKNSVRVGIERSEGPEGIPCAARGSRVAQARCERVAPVLLRCCEPVVPLGIRCTSLVHPLYNRCTWLLHHLGLSVCFGRCLEPSAPRFAPPKPATARTALTLSPGTQPCH